METLSVAGRVGGRRRRCSGYRSIARTVRSLALIAIVALALLPTWRPAAAAAGTTCFATPKTFGLSSAPQALAVADFNNDGRSDIAAGTSSGHIAVFLNQGGGSFGPDIGFNELASIVAMPAAEFTGDGNVDLFVVLTPSTLRPWRGQGNGTFTNTTSASAGQTFGHIVANVGGNAVPDFLWIRNESGLVRLGIALNNGMGGFAVPATPYPAGTSPYRLAVADFNRDGANDVVVTNRTSPGAVSLVLNDGTGAVGAPTSYAVQPMPGAVATGDMNRDGNPDVVVGEDGLDGVSLLLGSGAGGLGSAANLPTSRPSMTGQSTGLALGDFNRDGWPDVAIATTTGLSLLSSDGLGGFGTLVPVRSGDIASVAAADVNGDTWSDLVFIDRSTSTLLVLESCAQNQPPILTAPFGQTIPEDTPGIFSAANGNQISIADPDAGVNPVRVALAATNGTLTLGTTGGLTFLAGDGNTDTSMLFTAPLPNANAALSELRFDPMANFAGLATLTITVNDLGNTGNGAQQEAAAVVSITVQPMNDPPVAAADAYTLTGSTLTVPAPGVLANDTDVETSGLTAQLVRGPGAGGLTLNPNGSFVYMPTVGYSGLDSFTYRASDGSSLSGEVTVRITGAATACLPRPRVQPRPQVASGRLEVHVEATPLNGPANNLLRELRFGQLQNARVTLSGQTVASGQTVTPPPNTVAVDFVVERLTTGQATTVPLIVVDGCGEWSTFVGAGTGVQLTPVSPASQAP